jgi:hypothetical protein
MVFPNKFTARVTSHLISGIVIQLCPCSARAALDQQANKGARLHLSGTVGGKRFGLWALETIVLSLPLWKWVCHFWWSSPFVHNCYLLALDTCTYVSCGFFPADTCGLLCEAGQGPRG